LVRPETLKADELFYLYLDPTSGYQVIVMQRRRWIVPTGSCDTDTLQIFSQLAFQR
ncbi:unnamed protein product, partial [Rotaria magnacalcarata]